MKSLFAAFLMFFAITVQAAPQAGFEYLQTQQAIPGEDPAKVEVIELFWYGCPHCYHLEPRLAVWTKNLPKDVVFKRVPGIARPDWTPGGKAYYTLEALGLVDKLHVPLFDAIHKHKSLRPNDEAGLIDWITRQSGLDRKKVQETYGSFAVNTKVSRAMQVFRASGATGVPALVIDGQYLTSSTLAGGNDQALKVADYLIQQARAGKGLK